MSGASDGWKPAHNPWLIAIAVTLAAFMEVLDTTIVNVALPYIAGSLAASNDEATYTLTAYLVANGIVLTIARTLGEFGAVVMVSSNLPGISQTLTLLVSDRYNRADMYGAYAISTLLMTVAVIVLVVQVILDARRAKQSK